MSRILLFTTLFIAAFSFTSVQAQDFTVSELAKLRTSSLSNFETVVMDKGYVLNEVDKEYDHYATFRKGHDIISWGYIKNEHFQQIDTVIIYIMTKEADYDKLKVSVKENPAHPNKTHFFKNETHILHVNLDDDVAAHFFTKYNERPLYEVEILTNEGDRHNN